MTLNNDSTHDETKPRILVVGDAALPTGFARVIEGIFQPLRDAFEIHHLGLHYLGDPHHLPWPVYRAGVGGGCWGTQRLAELIHRIEPALIFVLNDIHVAGGYMEALQLLETRPPVVLYVPIDSGPVELETILRLEGVDRIVTYTDFGKTQLAAAVDAAKVQKSELNFPAEIEVVPHGVDTDVFFPIAGGREAARAKLWPGNDELEEAFIVFNGNRNQERKRIDTTMKGFALFAEGKSPSVKLYLHMGATDLAWDIECLARRLGISDRLMLSTREPTLPGFPSELLNLIYNACDIGLNTACAEGWGLVAHEHAATGAAQCVPGFGPCAELWEGRAVLLPAQMQIIIPKLMTEGWLITPETVNSALESLYESNELRRNMSDAALKYATSERLSWERISERWESMFREMMA